VTAAYVTELHRLMELNMKCVGGGAWILLCCPAEHEVCVFTAGSLFCVRPGCRNPHHRPAP